MTTAIIKHESAHDLVNSDRMIPSGKELMEIVETTKLLSNCPYYQKLGPHGILAIWLTAREMKLPVMMCLNGGMYTFSGQVSLSAQMMNMMLVNSGHRADVLELTDSICKIKFWRRDRPQNNCTFEYFYTIDMAKNAGLTSKANWKTNARDMLYNRCLSGGARKFMPDVIMGAYLIGELPDDENVIDVIPSTVEIPPVKPKEIEYITQEEANEISAIISDCDPAKHELMWEFLKKKCTGQDLLHLPKECLPNIRKILLERKAEYQARLIKEVPTSMDEVQEDE